MAARRAFSPAEVNALVPELDRVFRRLQELDREIGARANELERLGVQAPHASGDPAEVEERRQILAARVKDFQSEIDKIEGIGGILSDLELGLVDFPAVIDGREVLLCWQRGEPAVTHYRAPGAAFTDRRPLSAG